MMKNVGINQCRTITLIDQYTSSGSSNEVSHSNPVIPLIPPSTYHFARNCIQGMCH